MGAIVITYTVLGGIKAVTWSDVQQMCIIFLGLVISLVTVFVLLPSSVSVGDAVYLAGAAGRLNAVTTKFDWNDRFNIWSGLFGGTFLFLSYFGCDQSQVQRYLTGKSIAQSRLSLIFNAVAKIPMQFFILFIGAMVFVFYLFVQPPVLFRANELARIQGKRGIPADRGGVQPRVRGSQAGGAQRGGCAARVATRRRRNAASREYRAAQKEVDAARTRAFQLVESSGGEKSFNDTNYIFLSFVTKYLPTGIVGLVIAVIFAATMSASSGEINSLATVTVVDIYKRHIKQRRQRSPLPGGVAMVDAVLGNLCGGVRRGGAELRIADRGGELRGLAVLRNAAGLFRAGARVPAGGRDGGVLRDAGRAKRRSWRPRGSPTSPGSGTT